MTRAFVRDFATRSCGGGARRPAAVYHPSPADAPDPFSDGLPTSFLLCTNGVWSDHTCGVLRDLMDNEHMNPDLRERG